MRCCCCCCCWMLVVDDPTTGRRYLPSEKTPRRLLPLPPPALADIGDVDDMSLHSWRQSTPSSGRALALCSHSGCPADQKMDFLIFWFSFFSLIIRLNSEIFNFGGNFKSGNLLVDCCCDPAGGRHHCTESNGLENIAMYFCDSMPPLEDVAGRAAFHSVDSKCERSLIIRKRPVSLFPTIRKGIQRASPLSILI